MGDYDIQTIPENLVGSELPTGERPAGRSVGGRGNLERLHELQAMRREGLRAKKDKAQGWDLFPKFYRGMHYPNQMPKHKVKAVINLTQQLVERKAALLTDTKPTIKVIPTVYAGAKSDAARKIADAAQALEKVCEGIWRQRDVTDVLSKAIMMAEIFCGAGFHTLWNDTLGTLGDVDLQALDPRCIIPDPYVADSRLITKNRHAQYLWVDEVLPTNYLRDLFPKYADLIKGDVRYVSEGDEDNGPETILGKLRAMFGLGVSSQQDVAPRTLVSRGWLSDYSRDSAGSWNYKGGRYVIMTRDLLLVEKANPYIDREWPIDYLDWHFDPDHSMGFGDMELYKSPQELVDKMTALMVENAALMNNNIWIGDEDALDPKEWGRLSNIPGSFVKKRRGRDLHREQPPALHSGTNDLIKFLMGSMEKLSSVTEALQGNAAGSITSGIAIESLQTASQTVIRLKARQLEGVLNRIGNKMISRIFQYITDDRVYTLCGEANQLLAYHFERKKVLNDPDFAFDNFRFEVLPGSSLSMTKWQRGMLAVQLFAQGLIDEKAALDALEYPDRDEIQERMANAQLDAMNKQLEVAKASGQFSLNSAQRGGVASRGKGGGVKRVNMPSPSGALEQQVAGSPPINMGGSGI